MVPLQIDMYERNHRLLLVVVLAVSFFQNPGFLPLEGAAAAP